MKAEIFRPDFFREWSSRAAHQALASVPSIAKERCSHSAIIWCSIADAMEAGDEAKVALLMRNLTLMPARYQVPAH